jgi:NAD(P)-dependent dehydrogenase (short-subunit alcohol dehydrogenase family)/acyl carrier protein
LVEELAVRGHRVTAAVAGEGGLERRADGTFALHPSRAEGFRALLRELAEEGLAPRRILHLWSLDPAPLEAPEEERFARAQERGLHSLLALAGALSEQGLGAGVELTAVTRGAWRVDGGEESAPEQATVTGVLRVAPQELPGLRCRAIDLPSSSEEAGERRVASRLLAEVLAPAREPTVALRHHGRFVGAFDRVTLPAVAGTVPGLREKGVYLITGGLGRIGLTLAELLAREARARLVLVGRSPLPPREEWSGWLEEHDGDDPTCRRIRRLQELEALGAEVLVLAADVADETAMAAVVARAEERFGPLHGVIHGAGIVGERTHRLVSQTGHEETSWHFRPKARGVWVLERVLAGRELDFRILLSSISTVIGGLSFCAYAAANAYMNAFAAARSGRGEGPWTSLIWDAWRWQEEVEESGLGARTARLALTPSEGVETFRRLLAIADAPQLVVSTGDLEARIEEWVERPMAEGTGGSGPASALARHARPELPTPYVAPRDDTERAVAEVWQELLGVERIGAHDNFFELGGNSLLATRLISDLRSAFTVELPFELFFERPTVAEQASAIAAHGGAGSEAGATETDGAAGTIAAGGGEDILQQLEELEELSEDEAQALIDGGRE